MHSIRWRGRRPSRCCLTDNAVTDWAVTVAAVIDAPLTDASGGFDRRTEAPQSTTKCDRAQREPAPPEGEPAEHVAEPVDAQQHARSRHCDRDEHRSAGEE